MNIKIPMTVEREYSSSPCSWRVQRRGLGTMTQTSRVRKLKPPKRLSAPSQTIFLHFISEKIRRNHLERVASADEFTCEQACLLRHNFPRCLNPRVVGKPLGQISFDGSRNTAFLLFLCVSSTQRQCVCECECVGGRERKEQDWELLSLLGMNQGCPSWLHLI